MKKHKSYSYKSYALFQNHFNKKEYDVQMAAVVHKRVGVVVGVCCTKGFEKVTCAICPVLLKVSRFVASQFEASFRIIDEELTWRRVEPRERPKAARPSTTTRSHAAIETDDVVNDRFDLENRAVMLSRRAARFVQTWHAQSWADILKSIPEDVEDGVLEQEKNKLDERCTGLQAELKMAEFSSCMTELANKHSEVDAAQAQLTAKEAELKDAQAELTEKVNVFEENLAAFRTRMLPDAKKRKTT